MKVDICALADYANQGEGGKLNIMGIFDTVGGQSFPLTHRQLYLVLRLLAEFQDSETEQDIRVTLERPNGEKLVELSGQIRIGTIEPGQFQHKNHVIGIGNLQFESSGTYVFRIYIGGEQAAEKQLRVVQR